MTQAELSLLNHFPIPRHWVELKQTVIELKEHDAACGQFLLALLDIRSHGFDSH